jgi:transcriptional regulator with XRE-family HTH domain
MPTIEQIRAARALIGWSQGELAEEAGLSQTGIARIENGTNQPNSSTIAKITAAFDKADIEFIGESGVKKRVGEVRTLRGADGFKEFMSDVYETVSAQGGEICVFNVDEKNWIKWMGQDNYDRHAQKMKNIQKPYNFKIIVEENDWFFIASEVAEYRWFPKELFDKQSFYAYGKKLAFLNFSENDVQVMILEQAKFSDGFKVLFNVAWNNVAKIPKK